MTPQDEAAPAITQDDAVRSAPSWWHRLVRSRRTHTTVCWVLVVLWAIFAIIRLFGLEHTYYLDIFMAFTPYVTIATVIPIAMAALMRRWPALIVAVATLIALMALFIPRVVGSPDPGNGPEIRIASQNMKLGGADVDQIIQLVRDQHVDVLALEEFTPQAQRRIERAGILALLPYSATHPLLGATGSAIYSRYPLAAAGYMPLAGWFGSEYATVSVPGALPFQFYAVHADAPALRSENGVWHESLAQQPAATPKGTVRILAGDFNSTFDQAPFRAVAAKGYTDVASQLGDGLETTWPYDGRPLPPITLDHILVDPRVGAVSFGTRVTRGTDHKAIYATLTLPKSS